jgi:predicted chitinase
MLGIDLEGNPDLALQPSVAADILAVYFRDRHVDTAAINGNWKTTRRLVNGGLTDINRYLDVVRALGAE